MKREHAAPSSKVGCADSGHSFGFLLSSIDALCARDDVDPLRTDGLGEAPLDLAAELIKAVIRGKMEYAWMSIDGDVGPTRPPGEAKGKGEMRAMIKELRPMLPRSTPKVVVSRARRKRFKGSHGLTGVKISGLVILNLNTYDGCNVHSRPFEAHLCTVCLPRREKSGGLGFTMEDVSSRTTASATLSMTGGDAQLCGSRCPDIRGEVAD